MAFDTRSGPPASHRQLQELHELLAAAGHADLRAARGPLGLTQRQAAGKFTIDEAQTLIDELLEAEHQADGTNAEVDAKILRSVSAELLAAELQRRGWAVVQP